MGHVMTIEKDHLAGLYGDKPTTGKFTNPEYKPKAGEKLIPFLLADDDGIVYYTGKMYPSAVEHVFEWGAYYAGTTMVFSKENEGGKPWGVFPGQEKGERVIKQTPKGTWYLVIG